MKTSTKQIFAKVPEITIGFWLIKILCTTLGETAGDAVSMSLNVGYLISTLIFATLFIAAVWAQIKAKQFHPVVYWVAIVASTTVGTTLADFTTRSLGVGYTGGSVILIALLLGTLFTWHRVMGSVSIATITNARTELFYWLTITFSQTLGTALGDWASASADDPACMGACNLHLGYVGGIYLFIGLLAITALLFYFSKLSHVLLFWAAFILTRPLGAVVGDFMDKPIDKGGLELSRFVASGVIIVAIAVCLKLFKQAPAKQNH